MADGKLDPMPPANARGLRVNPSGSNDETRGILGSATERRDQVTLDSIIPLSPQWLHVKPNESKSGSSAVSGKDNWRLEGSCEKKDWRRNVPDSGSHRWHEEERETGLLGRRERKKEGDKDNGHRKSERRSDNVPARESVDSRTSLSYDRHPEGRNRSSGHDSRRDSKWSSSRVSEEKEKDSRSERRKDLDKEDACVEKQCSVDTNRLGPESDSHDKWRPRHRQDVFSGGTSSHRAAPGGRGDGSIVGFALGRGRPNCLETLGSRFSTTRPIGATSANKIELHGKSGLCTETFCYPRGKLLDIYSKQKALVLIDNVSVDFEDVPSITGSSSIQPLAFVAPDAEELALLDGIWNGSIISSEVYSDSTRCNFGRVDKQETALDQQKCKAEINGASPGGRTLSVVEEVGHHNLALPGCNQTESEQIVCKTSSIFADGHVGDLSLLKDAKFEDMNSDLPIDDSSVPPDDSNRLLDTSIILKTSQSDIHHQNINNETKQSGERAPHELSLFYRDPQGDIQGPFLGVDIVSWFERGFFNADLPVCLSDAPEGTPFMKLGEVMPHLTHKPEPAPSALTGNASEHSINLEGSTLSSSFTDAGVTKGQQLPGICKLDDLVNPQYERLPLSISETTDIDSAGKQKFHESADQDVEVVLYSGRLFNGSETSSGKLAKNCLDRPTSSNANYIQGKDLDEACLNNSKILADSDLHPLGLLWSELKGANSKGPLSSNLSSLSDMENAFGPATGGGGSFAGYRQESMNPISDPSVQDARSGKFSAGTGSNAAHNALQENHLRHMESESNQFSLQQFLNQQLQNKHLPQRQSLHETLHLTGPYADIVHGSMQHKLLNNEGHLDVENRLRFGSQSNQHSQQLQYLKQQSDQEQHIQQLQYLRQQSNQGQHIQEFQQLQQLCDQQMHTQHLNQQQMCDQQQLHHNKFQLLYHVQQQQREEQKQIVLKQLMHRQLCDSAFQASHINPLREENMLQALSRQPHLHEMQQQSPHVLRQHDPSFSRLIPAKLGHNLDERLEDLFQAVPYANQGKMHSMEQLRFDPQQEQHQTQQSIKTLQSWPDMQEDRRIGGVWSVDEHGQFVRAARHPHHVQSSGPSPLDYLQHQGSQKGPYRLNSESFERFNPMSENILRSNTDLVNILPQLEGQGIHGLHDETLSSAKMGQFPSAVPFHQNLINRCWSDANEIMPQDLIGPQLNQLSLESKHQHRDVNFTFNHNVEDAHSWGPLAGNDGISRLRSNNLLQQNLALQSSQYSGLINDAALPSHETKETSWPLSGSAIDHSHFLQDQVFMGNSLLEPSHFPGVGHLPQGQLMNTNLDHINGIETRGGFAFTPISESFVKHQGSIFPRNGSDEVIDDSNDVNACTKHLKVLKHESSSGNSGKKDVHELIKVAAFEIDPLDSRVEPVLNSYSNHEVLEDNISIRHSSVGKSGGSLSFSNYGVGVDNAFLRDRVINRIPAIPVEAGADSLMMPSQGPQILASRVSPSQLTFNQQSQEINLSKFSSAEDRRQESRGNSANPFPETPATGKGGSADTSFIDKLKSTKKPAVPESNANADTQDSGSAAHSTKKKGKKGKQIDPSLLGEG